MNINDLVPVSYAEQRVLTTPQIAKAYGTTTARIRDNFRHAKKNFVEGVHYFKVEGDELRKLREQVQSVLKSYAPSPVPKGGNSLTLWTEQGAVRHCKILNTPEAWKMFNELEQFYFNGQAAPAEVEQSAIIRDLQTRLDSLEKNYAELNQSLDGLDVLFKELFEGKAAPMERADKLIAIADKLHDDDQRDKILLQAANLIIGKKLF